MKKITPNGLLALVFFFNFLVAWVVWIEIYVIPYWIPSTYNVALNQSKVKKKAENKNDHS